LEKFFLKNRQVIALEKLEKSFSSGTFTTLPLPPSLQTFFCYFYNCYQR